MLAQFALIVFALCAVLSLVIDVGYARVTQSQMQNAADTAALEGLRTRDNDINSQVNAATGLPDGFRTDCLRRAAASHFVQIVFDDDLEPANGDPDYNFGAGPIIDLTEGLTDLHGAQTMSVPDVRSYKPALQSNQRNVANGDMVSGRFAYSADPISEDLNYDRTDFTPNASAPQPPGSLAACPPSDQLPPPTSTGSLTGGSDNAFLVRLRRSTEMRDLEGQTDPDVASSGPSMPLTFGKATTIFADDPAGGYSVRRDGLTVRATAIAQVRPALRIGLPQATLPGVTSFALLDTFVQTLNAVGCTVTVNPATGLIARAAGGAATCVTPVGTVVGRFVANAATVNTVGQALPVQTPVACATTTPAPGYGPVYSLMAASGTNRIIGFTRIGFARAACPAVATAAFTATISRGVALVAAANASAHVIGGLPVPATSTPAEITELMNKNRGVGAGSVNYAPVLVPALAR